MNHHIGFMIVGIIGVVIIILVILSCCKVSSDSDRQSEEWHRKEQNDDI